MQEIRSLTTLRFAAALWVFIFHIHIRWPLAAPEFLKNIIQQGAVGMSLFFILSGFVLGYNYHDGVPSVAEYARRRFARIYPVYVLSALVTLPFFSVTQNGVKGFGEGAFVVVSDLLMLQAWFPPLFQYWNNSASWSLSAEAFFYAMFPFIVGVLARASTRQIVGVLAGAYVLSVLPGLSYALIPKSPSIYYSLPIYRVPEFIAGVAGALLMKRGFRLPRPKWCVLASVATLAASLGALRLGSGYFVTANVVAVPSIIVIILGLSQIRSRILESEVLVVLGRASYAFYSLQPLLILTMLAMQRGLAPWTGWFVFGLSFAVLTGLSLAVYLLVEEPMRRLLTRRPKLGPVAAVSP